MTLVRKVKTIDKDNNKYVYDVVAKNIKRIRKSKGLSQVKLADMTFYHEGTIANIENRSETTFSLELLYVIAKTLDTPLKEFFIDSNGKDL